MVGIAHWIKTTDNAWGKLQHMGCGFNDRVGRKKMERSITKNRFEMCSANKYTHKQGQYLAYIYYFTKINGEPPAEFDMQYFFNVSPPSVHQMILTLEKHGFISRQPGKPRAIRVLLPFEELPPLD